jgi:homoserine dehydrogenase
MLEEINFQTCLIGLRLKWILDLLRSCFCYKLGELQVSKDWKVIFVGFGTVAQGCAEHLVRKAAKLKKDYDFDYKVVGITDVVKGSIQDDDGINLSEALEIAKKGRKLDEHWQKGKTGLSSIEMIRSTKADVLIEATWTNLKDGEPGLTHIRTALENDMDVVTSNKGPIALAFRRLSDLAKSRGRQLRFEATVMSGTPVFNLREHGLAGANISRLMGILNGTTNYILTEMAAGMSYDAALKRAQQLGYAEAEPSGDVEAYDPAAKITILANTLLGGMIDYKDVEREGISHLTIDDVRKAIQSSMRIKLIASASRTDDGRINASVKPTLVPETDLLAHVTGVLNALQITMDVQPDVTIIGPGAGGDSAGYGLLNDILAIHRSNMQRN